ncbi:MAG TPA: HD domain-containing protein, partial [Phormidium sp.]
MHSYAQTNLQLFNQLSHTGYSKAELNLIYNTYQLVMELFTGSFRSSGKTFIAHLVGTASILASLGASGKVVAAGLLHAAYSNGDFGDGKKGINNARREKIRLAVGEEVEEYIVKYTALQWNEKAISTICDGIDTLSSIERDVLLIRLTNELEEYLDLGILYCGSQKYQRYVNHSSHLMVKMAEELGFPTLAEQLTTVLQ